jgi:UDP-glucose 4-epimerase
MRLVAGGSGVVGSGFIGALAGQGLASRRLFLPWGDPRAVADRVAAAWVEAQMADPAGPVTLIWAAGTGTVGAGAATMSTETETVAAVVDALARVARGDPRDCLMFSSSAGALYGGHGPGRITDETIPSPITAYGREKLAQEELLAHLAASGAMRTVTCRFTNVFGLTAGRLRPKGLVAALVQSALTRQPARIFVSPDTRRDYLFNRDAARLALAEAEASSDLSRICIVRSGSTMTIVELVAAISRVLRRRVPVVFIESQERMVQPRELQFAVRRAAQARVPTTTFEAAIRTMAEAPLART